jgi:4-carboxymuconolactone decarboxylase
VDDAQYVRGVEQFRSMVGPENIDRLRSRLATPWPEFERLVMGIVGGEIWARGGLDAKTRSLCSLAILAGLGRSNALALNAQMAIRNGATQEEIFEVMLHVAAYAGFAAAWDALDAIRAALDASVPSRPTPTP